MDLVLAALINPLFWSGAAFGGIFVLACCLLLVTMIGRADEALERAEHVQRTYDRMTWPGSAERDARGSAPRTRRSDLRSAPR